MERPTVVKPAAESEAAIKDALKHKGREITCTLCHTKFPHSGKPEFQVCPGCGTDLII